MIIALSIHHRVLRTMATKRLVGLKGLGVALALLEFEVRRTVSRVYLMIIGV